LLSAYACEPHRGSEQGRGWHWAKSLARYGHEVVVLTTPNGRPAIEAELAAEPLPTLQMRYVDIPEVERYLRGERAVLARYLGWQWRAYQLARTLVSERRFDLVHHVTLGSLHRGSLLWRLGLPFVFGPMGGGQTAPAQLREFYGEGWAKEAMRSFGTRRLMRLDLPAVLSVRNAQLVLCKNRETEQLARRLGARNAKLFLDVGIESNQIPAEPPVRQPSEVLRLLWVHRIYPQKGLPLALRAVAAVPPDVPLKLTLVGGGPLEDRIPAMVNALGLRNRVEHLGKLAFDEVKRRYLTSDALLFTSLRDTFGAQLTESLAYGLPIILLSQAGARDHVPAAASIKVPVTTPQRVVAELAAAIERLYRNPDEREAMGRAGWEFARANYDRKAEVATELYGELLGTGSASRPSRVTQR
jgi:glycosyltransferase involved in cell wall biosynthesis